MGANVSLLPKISPHDATEVLAFFSAQGEHHHQMKSGPRIRFSRRAFSGALLTAIFCLASAAFSQVQSSPRPSRQHSGSSKAAKKSVAQKAPREAGPALEVTFKDGLLSVIANDAAMLDALEQIHQSTGATIITPSGILIQDKVTVHLGPAPAAQVVTALLEGAGYDYVIAGSPRDPLVLASVFVSVPTAQAEAMPAPIPSVAPGPPVADGPSVADNPAQETRTETVANLTGSDEGANQRVEAGTPATPAPSTEQPAPAPVPK